MVSIEPLASSEKLDLQAQEDQWWDTSAQYRKYSDLPALSKWHSRIKSGQPDMLVISVDGRCLTFPRPWLSILFLLDLQQLSCMAQAIICSTNPTYSARLYSNVGFIHKLRLHVIQARLEVKNIPNDWMPQHLERWMRRLVHGLSSEKGAYTALKENFDIAYQSGTNVWKLGNHLLFLTLFSNLN